MDSEKTPLLTLQITDIEVGDIIHCDKLEWRVQSFLEDGRFTTLCRYNFHVPFSGSLMTWRGDEFMHEGYFLIKKKQPLFTYNPAQAGDTDDDI